MHNTTLERLNSNQYSTQTWHNISAVHMNWNNTLICTTYLPTLQMAHLVLFCQHFHVLDLYMPHFSENLTGQRSHFMKQWLQGTRDHTDNSFHVFKEAALQMTAVLWVSVLCSGWMFLTFWKNILPPPSGWQSWFGYLGGCWSDSEERLLQVT